jgi:tRNA(fMet)-specific endonuclease VapC
MLQFLWDTDHLTLFHHGHAAVLQRYAAQPADAVGISAVTIEEVMRGRLTALSRATTGAAGVRDYGLLVAGVALFLQFPRVAYDGASENHFQQLLALKLRIGTQDLKIASVALANNLTVLTRNRRDFGRIPGLVLDDRSV